MIQGEFILPIAEFVSRADTIPGLTHAILFGSVARGEADRRSDIDLCLVFRTRGDPERGKGLRVARDIAEGIEEKHDVRFAFTVNRLRDLDAGLLENLCKEGLLVWGKPLVTDTKRLGLKPFVILSYDISRLPSSEKVRIHRMFHGYRTVRRYKEKEYVSEKEGLIKSAGGRIIGRGVVMFPAERMKYVTGAFDKRVRYSLVLVWTHEGEV